MEQRELVKLAFQTRLSLLSLCKQQGSLPKPFARVTPHAISASKPSSSGENHDKTNPLTSTQLYTTVDDISTDYDDEIIWKLFAVSTSISPISIHIHPIIMYHICHSTVTHVLVIMTIKSIGNSLKCFPFSHPFPLTSIPSWICFLKERGPRIQVICCIKKLFVIFSFYPGKCFFFG